MDDRLECDPDEADSMLARISRSPVAVEDSAPYPEPLEHRGAAGVVPLQEFGASTQLHGRRGKNHVRCRGTGTTSDTWGFSAMFRAF
ncbi:hypothetical protein C6A85_000000109770 [Mycobacterium sp. ITM-2017-0098]|nr:hypothetical protein C6A85_000000109770 [Mycobacterium sp. ITM-2017-0098]